MGDLYELSTHRDWFTDDRGDGRRLQVTWHPERQLVVLSVWHNDRCTASFRLPITDADRLIGLLVTGLAQEARTAARPADAATSWS